MPRHSHRRRVARASGLSTGPRFTIALERLEPRLTPVSPGPAWYADPDPQPHNGFGTDVVALPNGAIVVTAPFQDVGGVVDAGAVYLFTTVASTIIGVEPKAVVAAVLCGSSTADRVGSGGVVVLANGNYVVASPHWDLPNTAAEDAGAVTWQSASVTASGGPLVTAVTQGNSLHGHAAYDWVGLSSTYDWAAAHPGNAGYGDWQQSPDGYDFKQIQPTERSRTFFFEAITPLTNGNYVVASPFWNLSQQPINDSTAGNGAVTLIRADGTIVGNTAVPSAGGAVSITNSVYGPNAEDFVGSGAILDTLLSADQKNALGDTLLRARGVTPLSTSTQVNYVITSPMWSSGGGAVTWVNGETGRNKPSDVPGIAVSQNNSLYGVVEGSHVGSGGIIPLVRNGAPTGAYVANSPLLKQKREVPGPGGVIGWVYAFPGATTRVDETGQVYDSSGIMSVGANASEANSLLGVPLGTDKASVDSYVGIGGVYPLQTGGYVVNSPEWNAICGAVTFGLPDQGIRGYVSSDNSLLGKVFDRVGSGGVFLLSDGGYVVSSPSWNQPSSSGEPVVNHVGAVTWFDSTGRMFRNDEIPGVHSGSPGGYINPIPDDIDSWNSLVGASFYKNTLSETFGDRIGFDGITEVMLGDNRYYTVASSKWNQSLPLTGGAPGQIDGNVSGCFGAVTLCDMTGRVVVVDSAGTTLTALQRGVKVTAANSLHGDGPGDYVGGGGVTALAKGNFVVTSPEWRSRSPEELGFGGAGGGSGGGSDEPSHLGAAMWVGKCPDGTYRGVANVSNNQGVVVSPTNSLVGENHLDRIALGGVVPLANGDYVVTSPDWNREMGAVTWGSGANGVSGFVDSATNKTVRGSTSLDVQSIGDRVGSGGIVPLTDGNYVVLSPSWNAQDQPLIDQNGGSKYTRTGAVTRVRAADGLVSGVATSPQTIVSGVNSLVGTHVGSRVGSGGVTPVAGGNYVVHSPEFATEATASGTSTLRRQAVTWRSAATTGGVVSTRNSLFGKLTAAGIARDSARGRFLVGLNDPDDSPISNVVVRGLETGGFPPPAVVNMTAFADTTLKGNGSVAEAVVTFSQRLNSIAPRALRLRRDAVEVPLDDTITLVPVGDTGYRITGLDNFNTVPGSYDLTVFGSLTENVVGIPGDGVATASWTVMPAPVLIDVTAPPTSHRFGTTFGFVAEIRSADGSRSTLFNGPVSVTAKAGPGSLSGTTTVSAVNGLVTFSGLRLSASGQYKLEVTNPFLQPTSVDITSRVEVTDQKIYHKGSSFAGTSVDAALDPGKVLVRPGSTAQTLAYANLINGSRGLNGVVIDVAGLASTSLTAADFSFRMSPQGNFNEAANPPSAWATAPAPSAVVVTAGTATTPARLRPLEWADNAIVNRWLQIAVLASTATGLDAPEISYVGHLTGEINGAISSGLFRVTNADYQPVAAAVGSTVTVGSVLDIVKDGRIRNTDVLAVSQQVGLRELRVITIPVAGSASHGTFGSGPSGPSPAGGEPRGGSTSTGSIDFAALAAWAGATQPATQTDPANPAGSAKPKR